MQGATAWRALCGKRYWKSQKWENWNIYAINRVHTHICEHQISPFNHFEFCVEYTSYARYPKEQVKYVDRQLTLPKYDFHHQTTPVRCVTKSVEGNHEATLGVCCVWFMLFYVWFERQPQWQHNTTSAYSTQMISYIINWLNSALSRFSCSLILHPIRIHVAVDTRDGAEGTRDDVC